ncbi:MAG: PAS domain S-box protein [Ignavibacteria bacterium]|jgi:PAS domain S-box-containing protein|nr:PAS domain S-box protein [Ignavibacteria bacterium]MCU7502663.1 PAS domain S-box protein [Ignavibacteria bacterium]MCU7515134.1 PAS domain S-box protein [Ignavibacteria bacterium]
MGYIKQFLLLFLMIVVCGYLFYDAYYDVKEETVKQFNKEQNVHALQAATGIRTFFNHYKDQLGYFSVQDEVANLNRDGKELLTRFYFSHRHEIMAVTRIDSAGRVLFTAPYNSFLMGRNISYQEHVKRFLKFRKDVLSDVFNAVQGYRSVAYYVPVFQNGRFKGGIAVLVPFENLSKNFLKDIKVRDHGTAWIVSHEGTILYDSVAANNFKPVYEVFRNSPTALSMIRKILKGQTGSGEYYKISPDAKSGSSEVRMHAVYLPVHIADQFWSIIVSTPEKEVLGAMRGFIIKWLSIIILLISGILVYLYYAVKAEAIIKEEKRRRLAERALKDSEKKFRTLVELSPDAITLIDLDSRILACNKQAAQMLGFVSPEDLIGKNSLDMIVPGDRREVEKRFLELLKEGSLRNVETKFIRKDGHEFPVEFSTGLVCDSSGKPLSFTCVARDITSRKEAEKELLEAKERAEKLDKLKSEFLAQMSHEIRSPINSVLSFSGLLEEELDGRLSEDLQTSFSIIRNAGKRIIRTVDLILNMSEIQTGTYELMPRKFDLMKDVLEKLQMEFCHQAKDKGIELLLENRTGKQEVKIFADEYTVGQIFNNLVNNAVKYTDRGKISMCVERNESDDLVVSVRDTGIGISEEYLPNLFKPFTQEEQGYTRKYEGNGLGLALVKKYCEMNDLKIEVESKKGLGSVFRIMFS